MNNKKSTGQEKDNNRGGGKRMSAFAESAYAHATHESTPPRQSFLGNVANKIIHGHGSNKSGRRYERMQDDGNDLPHRSQDYDLLYCPDSTVQGTVVNCATFASLDNSSNNNVVHAEFQPLAGASIVILTGTTSDSAGNNPHPRTIKIMEESESIGFTIESMGGRVRTLESGGGETITHAIWVGDDGEFAWSRTKNHTIWEHFTKEALDKLSVCQSMDIPVVNISWLVDISKLFPGAHWSDVDVEAHKPFVAKVLEKYNRHKLESKIHSSSRQHRRTEIFRDESSKLSASIGSTFNSLLKENPDAVEEDAIKRAMELSMLDFAIVHHIPSERHYTNVSNNQRTNGREEDPYEVLRITAEASSVEVKAAYRQRALETHPDKGGKPGEFEAVARAYRILLNSSNKPGLDNVHSQESFDKDGTIIGLKSTAHWDSELKEHRNLVRELYTSDGHDIDAHIIRQSVTLERLGLRAKDAGSQSVNEKNERIKNSCFYLSLACSYLSGIAALEVWDVENDDFVEDDNEKSMLREADARLIMDTALSLKRTIEAAVLSKHPEWAAQGMVGEEVQAFSDFLVYTLESQTIVSDWAVVVFDTCSGFVDVYKGRCYANEVDDRDDTAAEAYASSNTITLQYLSGHYQPLFPSSKSSRPSLKRILNALDESGVFYVVTDGAAKPK